MKRSIRCVGIPGVALVALVAARPCFGSSEDALGRQVSVAWKKLEVSVCLRDLSKIGGVSITLDPGLPGSVGETLVSYSAEDVPLRVALGHVLRKAGLRYAVTESGLFVSTPDLLAKAIVYSGMERVRESEPMDLGEALNVLSREEREDDEAFGLGDPAYGIDCRPHRLQERPRYNPVTGLTDYPGPPIWMLGDDDINDAHFRYSRHPYFPTPHEIVRQGAEQRTEHELVAHIVELLHENPGLFARVLKVLEEERK